MKIFDITAETTRKEYEIDINSDKYFCCPVCKNAYIKFEEHQYHSTDSNFTTPRAICSNCGSVFFQVKEHI